MSLLLLVTGMLTYQSWKRSTPVITTNYVEVPAYTGRAVEALQAQIVDDNYMDTLMSDMLSMYNQIRGTDYTAWEDEQVSYTTQGKYASEAEWRAYLQVRYKEIEEQYAEDDMAQLLLTEIVSDSRLLEYEEEDYIAAEEAVKGQLIYGNGFLSEDALLEGMGWSAKEYQSMVKEYTLQTLKINYVMEAIATAEGLEPTEAEMEADQAEHMAGVIEMGYTEEDEYYKAELQHWEEEKASYRLSLIREKLLDFLYQNNKIQ